MFWEYYVIHILQRTETDALNLAYLVFQIWNNSSINKKVCHCLIEDGEGGQWGGGGHPMVPYIFLDHIYATCHFFLWLLYVEPPAAHDNPGSTTGCGTILYNKLLVVSVLVRPTQWGLQWYVGSWKYDRTSTV